jgi:hypothetical protein
VPWVRFLLSFASVSYIQLTCCSTIIGASIGGVLARPAKAFPSLFAGTIFDSNPYLLPNLICTGIVVLGLVIGILFLEETHEDKKHDKDRGLELGQWLLSKIWMQDSAKDFSDKDGSLDELRSLLDGHEPRMYRSTDSSPTLCSSRTSIAEPPSYFLEEDVEDVAPKLRDAFTKQVCLNIIGYGILAL